MDLRDEAERQAILESVHQYRKEILPLLSLLSPNIPPRSWATIIGFVSQNEVTRFDLAHAQLHGMDILVPWSEIVRGDAA